MAQNGDRPNLPAVATGFGIGGVWILSALYLLFRSVQGATDHRPDYALAWGLVGTLLLAAGTAAVVGTWWHLLRRRPDQH